ncbi:uncharacterized protein A1O9_11706 [Exophiala aquamarina CBS 119918]|uniref:Chitin-binding type-1 domain-containing protein n=1 Tax=Exophiala aquamarina CBS 119918 TaxID=1182545 RepID=A0A072P910_9EURO|nr:uncharacterized protein A1O9_11706 [Exophiala aquamarina CBS 119918]KEF52080.1 hypothetical protein A1O9_11706 [Exophiala aquamarina CBS 119918]
MKRTMRRFLVTAIFIAIADSASAQDISTNGDCGSRSSINATCLGSTFGDCCSTNGYCGSTDVYCGAGCQVAFGTCSDNASSISPDGRCGQENNAQICLGSTFGSCCSEQGWCGNNSTYCGTGCQSDFGECNAVGSTTSSPAASATSDAVTATSSTAVATSGSKTTDSVGFKVGMVFVGLAAAAIILGLIFFIVRQRRRSTIQKSDETVLEKDVGGDLRQLPQLPVSGEPQELNSSQVQEMSTDYNKAQDEKKLLSKGMHELP